MKKRGLGKGLEALLGDNLSDNKSMLPRMVALDSLSPNPYQPRALFDEEAIGALAESIRQHGIIQPLAVRSTGNVFEIIAGERRFRAAKMAGLAEVPVVVHEVCDHDSAVFALVENLQREDLNVIEKAKGIQSLIQNFRLTHEACGKILGQSRSSVSNTLRLLELNPEVQAAVVEKIIDMGHARALLSVEKAIQYELLKKIRLNGLSVRETEALVRKKQQDALPVKKNRKTSQIKQLEASLSQHLQTKVQISQQPNGNGKVTVAFDNEAMLELLSKRLGL